MGFEIAVQTVIYQKLASYAPLLALVVGVYDDVDEDQLFPYVTIGESTHNAWDTDNTLGDDTTISVHVWSRKSGKKETKTIQGEIYNALQRSNLTYAGHDIIAVDWVGSETFMDADGKTRHGVQTFRVLLERV